MSFDQLRHYIYTELDLWRTKRKSETVKAKQLDTPAKPLSFVDKDYFPNIYVILVISATLPVTSCECERSISGLKSTGKKKTHIILIYFDSTSDQFFHICIKTVIIWVQI